VNPNPIPAWFRTAADCSQLSERAGHNHLGIRQLPLSVLEELLEIILPPMNAPARRSPQPNRQLMRRLDIREMRCSAVSTAKNKSTRPAPASSCQLGGCATL